VLLKGYAAWGIDRLLAKLDGMFAFCLYDKNILKKRIFLPLLCIILN
jgi:asparagine synthetase B (glutamine-hydrolysing)